MDRRKQEVSLQEKNGRPDLIAMGYSDSDSESEKGFYLSGSSDEEYNLETEKKSELVTVRLHFHSAFKIGCSTGSI